MTSEANVLPFPRADERLTCHVRFPNVSAALHEFEDVAVGLAHVAALIQEVAEQFDELALLFDECPQATFRPGTHFIDGELVFIFEVPRRQLSKLVEMGFEPVEDVS